MIDSSRISGFHKLSPEQRQAELFQRLEIDPETSRVFTEQSAAGLSIADAMSENVIGSFNLPFAVATNLRVDGIDVLVPMVTEESSVVAAVCNGAKQCRQGDGVRTTLISGQMIGQIQILELSDPQGAVTTLYQRAADIKSICDLCDPTLVSIGGGYDSLEVRVLETKTPMVILHVLIDTRDAMGANAVNSMMEKLAPNIEEWTGGRVGLKILSNLADRKVVRASAEFRCEDIGGETVRDEMLLAGEFALADPYRAATHNKGIMNGVSAVTMASGNDTRAVEAGAHAYAARTGCYTALTRWGSNANGDLVGTLEMPMPVGIVGGATRVHPSAKLALAIMQISSARQLVGIIGAVGLVQNFSAMKALVTEGIQRGHMSLHAKNLAVAVGATGDEITQVSEVMVGAGKIDLELAQKVLEDLRCK